MKTEVRFHERVRPALGAWLAEIARRQPGGQIASRIIVNAIRLQLMRDPANISTAIKDDALDPPLYWWQFFPGQWISYVIRDRGIWIWRRRKIIVYSIGERPPVRVLESIARA